MYINSSTYVAVGTKKKGDVDRISYSHITKFLIRNLKKLYEFTVIPRFTAQFYPQKR